VNNIYNNSWSEKHHGIKEVEKDGAPVSGCVSWLRGDYFACHPLGKSADQIDIVELNREKEMTGNKKPR
jgi:hypothetical protein